MSDENPTFAFIGNSNIKKQNLCLRVLVFLLFAVSALAPTGLSAQVAGLSTLSVLDMASTSRPAGLGLDYIAIGEGGLEAAIDNPSMLALTPVSEAVGAFVPMFAGSNATTLAYSLRLGGQSRLSVGVRMFNYGRFAGYDEEETYEGDFGAGDYSLIVGWGAKIDDHFSVGINFKPIISQYEHYSALAQAFDVAAGYVDDEGRLAATVMARNVGAQILTFDRRVEALPYELSATMSYKLSRAPFRVYMAATELQHWNLRYDDPLNPRSTTDPFTGEVTTESWLAGTADNLLRHVQVGVELLLGSALRASVGYNYRQGREMVGAEVLNMSAISFGVALHTRHFDFGYAHRGTHLAQAPDYLTLTYRF